MSETLSTVISGSFRKHLSQLYALRCELETRRVNVLSPVGKAAVNAGEEIIILDEDPIADRRILQDAVFAKIRRSSFLTLCNVEGYIGAAATLEMGYAIANGIQILTLEDVKDPNLAAYSRPLSAVFGEGIAEAVRGSARNVHHR